MMLYDGTDRVYVTGLKNSGRKTLISSIIHEFAFNAVWSDGNQWELSAMGKDAEMLEDAELIEKKMTSLEKIKVFDLPFFNKLDLKVITPPEKIDYTLFRFK